MTFDGSGQGVCTSGVTLVPTVTPDFVGVHGSGEGDKGELACWARFVLKNKPKQTRLFLITVGVPTVKMSILLSLEQLSFFM